MKMSFDLLAEKREIIAELNKFGCANRRFYYKMTAKQRRQRGITSNVHRLYKRLKEIERDLEIVENFLLNAE